MKFIFYKPWKYFFIFYPRNLSGNYSTYCYIRIFITHMKEVIFPPIFMPYGYRLFIRHIL